MSRFASQAERWRAGLVAGALLAALAAGAGGVARAEVTGVEVRQPVVAGPLASSAGYANRLVVVREGDGLDFRNADAALHDVVSVARDEAGDHVFGSELIDLGGHAEVAGVEDLDPGTYQFYCSAHPNMLGALTVRSVP